MNDRLRFRVWDKVFNEYWTDEQIKENASWLLFPNNANIDCIKIERCTGVEDKNGKLIYEGDRVAYPNKLIGEIVFSQGCFWSKHPIGFGNYEYIPLFHNTSLEIVDDINEIKKIMEK